MTGRLRAIAIKPAKRAAMELLMAAEVTETKGITGCIGGKARQRKVTVIAIEDWAAATAELGQPDLPWTTRRANLLVEGIALPRVAGARLQVGSVQLEVVEETAPCGLMEKAAPGLRAALRPGWRGGIACRVLSGGLITLSDPVRLIP